MGTTINGVYKGGKTARRERALQRNEAQFASGVKMYHPKEEVLPLTKEDKERIAKEIAVLKDRLSGKKRQKIDKQGVVIVEKDRWFIDIYQINMSYVKNSVRRKNKGKSKKKMKRQKSVSFLKSIVSQPGMVQNFRDGKMGVSPKNHTFRLRKEEPVFFN